MALKFLLLFFLSTLISTKILVMDYQDFPKFLKSVADSGKPSNSRKLSEVDIHFSFNPIICNYEDKDRPGFDFKGEKMMLEPKEASYCYNPRQYPIDRIVELNGNENLSNCAGIPYKYMENGKEVNETLYPARSVKRNWPKDTIYPGYYSKEKKNKKIFNYGFVEDGTGGGNFSIFCRKV